MAKNSILSIAIQIVKSGNGDKETVKGLAQLQATISKGLGAFAALAGAAYTVDQALNATVGTFVAYAAQVRDLSRITGTSAEETSRLIQAADDVKISYESLQKALWFASKNGFDVNTESLARLADEYSSLADPTARAKLLTETFGKSGADMGKMLERGADGVRELTSAVADNMVLTDAAVATARLYEMQIDAISDSIEGVKISVGQGLTGMLTGSTAEIQRQAQEIFKLNNGYEFNTNMMGRYTDAQREAWAEAQRLATEQYMVEKGLKASAEAAEQAADKTEILKKAEEQYHQAIQRLGEYIGGELGQAQTDHQTKIEEIREAYSKSGKDLEIYRKKKEEIREEYYQQIAAAGDDVAAQQEARAAYEQSALTLRTMYNDGTLASQEMQKEIDAETEAFNKRAASIMFNIQQQAIMAAVEQDPSKQQEAVQILGQMAENYGLIDQAQKDAMITTASLTDQWLTGALTADEFSAKLQAQTQAVQVNTGALRNEAEAIYHVGERAKDTADPFGVMNEAQAALGDGINKGAAPAVGNLKTQINGLPADGTMWNWYYSISGSGSFPRIPSRGTATGPGAGQENNAGNQEFSPDPTTANQFAAGGQLNLGMDWSMVGEQGFELISPSGFVFTHEQSKALLAGSSFSGGRFMMGGQGPESAAGSSRSSGTSNSSAGRKRRPRDRGSAPPVTGSDETTTTTTGASDVDALASSTEAAMQSAAAAQQQQVAEGIQTRNAIQAGNAEMAGKLDEIRAELHQLNTTLPRSLMAAAQQANP